MSTESRERPRGNDEQLQRAIVSLLLADEDRGPWSRAELAGELGAAVPELQAPLARLGEAGVVELDEEQVSASAATRLLDALELIGI